jgi:predicted anti-sigma-YlaC factor YlaD
MTECARFEELLVDYLGDELDDETTAELRRHLEGCESCRAALADYEQIVSAYRDLPEVEPSRESDEAILAESRIEVAGGRIASIAPEAGSRSRRYLALGIGLAAMVALGLALWWEHGRRVEQENLAVEALAERDRLRKEAEEAQKAALAAAAAAAREAEEAAAEAKRLKGTLEEKEALARAKKLAEEAEQAKAKSASARKSGATEEEKLRAKKGKKKKGMGNDPLGADFEL